MTDAILAGAVLAAMAALAVHDARRALVDPRLVLALLGAAAAWRFLGADGAEGAWARLAGGVLGAALGVASAMVPIAAASWLGRRWPLYPGDAMMLGALGFLLGVPGLAWTMLLGSGFALLYRFCVQRRRGRPFRKGLVPLGPGMCAGAAVVFLCVNLRRRAGGGCGGRDGDAALAPAGGTAGVGAAPGDRAEPGPGRPARRAGGPRRLHGRRRHPGFPGADTPPVGARGGGDADRGAPGAHRRRAGSRWPIRRRWPWSGGGRSPGCSTGWRR